MTQYFDRFDPTKNFDGHLFVAGRGLQAAELNELQTSAAYRLRSVADALFKDGDIVRDAQVVVDPVTGHAKCASGAIYLAGAVRGVLPGEFDVPVVGAFTIGVRLVSEVITILEDPTLRDPAAGTRNYDNQGADRTRITPAWGWSGDGAPGDFYPVYEVVDGVLGAKEPPPAFNAITQSIARYDRDSAGGTYVVSGLDVKALDDDSVTGDQVYTLVEGRARVYGYPIEFGSARRITYTATPDLNPVVDEPHLSTGVAAQRVNLNQTPVQSISRVAITAQKTATLTHNVATGAKDPLPDQSVLQVSQVKQGAVIYNTPADYVLTAGQIDWSPSGAEPAPGSAYDVTYQYITITAPTAVDSTGFTVAGAVAGTLILTDYEQMLPRIDRLCLTTTGEAMWVKGVSALWAPQAPSVPADVLPLASIYQTWDANRTVTNDGVRVVPMPQLAAVDDRLDLLVQLIAQQRLESDIHTREAGTKKGLFTDPFIDDSQRDAGLVQTAAIVSGELTIAIAPTILTPDADVTAPTTCDLVNAPVLEQTLRTGSMQIDPYRVAPPIPARVELFPDIDRWTDVMGDFFHSHVTQRWATALAAANAADTAFDANRKKVRDAISKTKALPPEVIHPREVRIHLKGFRPGEQLNSALFDGVPVVPVPL